MSKTITYVKGLGIPQISLTSEATGVKISWNQIANAEGYRIFRKEAGGSYVGLTTVTSGTTTSYIDTTAVEGTSYVYAVRAYQGTAQSSFLSKNITYVK